ncbi:chromate transporter [Paenibacillus baekrokdamisoli]|uniref:Chromate transporter n=1 Tax=Paenibacillus baekrokdamisoli TaxID=1712516 RepID=A0A3G9J553_9BACL|nr:chromate efflux transporter [Paenibacillus baekrokdamisoli]MBB3070553.1 chromate transporter [Paenibacillus baekrokdamisoli]BBH19903.1 chromate transporter [Paenibacillus baekrokdamisoli]
MTVELTKQPNKGNLAEVFLTALKLGLTSFGGPTAHIGYFRDEYVIRKKWLNEHSFADLVALCQFLPGPASSQLGMAIGIRRAGLFGAFAAWIGFTMPSALLMLMFALTSSGADVSQAGWLQGLKLAAVAIVGLAVWSMGRSMAAGPIRGTLAIGSAAAASFIPGAGGQLVPLLVCAIVGLIAFRSSEREEASALETKSNLVGSNIDKPISFRAAWLSLFIFVLLLIFLPIAAHLSGSPLWSLADRAYRAGSLVFGGGHAILPMLEQEVVGVGAGKTTTESFTAGYGAVQAMPGPLFTFAAYIGASMAAGFKGILYGTVALISIFLPSFLLLTGALPFWSSLRRNRSAQAALMGVNAAIVGILLAALYNPIWYDTVRSTSHFIIVLLIFLLLHIWKRQPWQAVLVAALAGWLIL